MPFFASLWTKQRHYEFATGVADLGLARGRVGAAGGHRPWWLWLRRLVELLFMGGRFSLGDARECALYFAIFSISLFLWSAQAIYSRAFYAAGNTFIPMAAGTVVTLVSLPIYYWLYHLLGAMGLAVASDVWNRAADRFAGRAVTPAAHGLAGQLDYAELGRCLLAGVGSGVGVWALFGALGRVLHRISSGPDLLDRPDRVAGRDGAMGGGREWVLEKSGSALPRVTMKRLGMG